MKEATKREALLHLSAMIEDLLQLGAPITSDSIEWLENFYLSGVTWGLDQQFRKRPLDEAEADFARSIQDFRHAGIEVTEKAALTLSRFFHAGVQWGLEHQFLERKKIITPDLFH